LASPNLQVWVERFCNVKGGNVVQRQDRQPGQASFSFTSGFVSLGVGLLSGAIAFTDCLPVLGQSAITADTTLGSESSQVIQNFQGLPLEIISGGAERGQNLFHSFQQFNVAAGRSAYFFNANPAIVNIIARVTGNTRSDILGTLGTLSSQPVNLFLINPNGIVFGPQASLNVSGSFLASTANAVQFGDAGFFSATNPEVPAELLTVNPSAFLFNQIPTAAIANHSIANAGRDPSNSFGVLGLRVPDGRSLILLGGDVTADGGSMVAFGGRIEIGSAAGTGSVGLNIGENTLTLNIPENLARADVTLTNGAGFLATTGTTGGDVVINARNINVLNGSSIQTGIGRNLGTLGSQAGNIIFNAQETLTIAGGSSRVENNIYPGGVGNAGEIRLSANSIDLLQSTNGDGYIRNNISSEAEGNTGGIFIRSNSLSVRNGFQIQSLIYGEGNSGGVKIEVPTLVELDGLGQDDFPSGVFTNVEGGIGNAGDISIDTINLRLTNGAQIAATTEGTGNAGNIRINAQDQLLLLNSIIISEVTEGGGIGTGGDITISTGTLEMRDGSLLLADTENIGNAGNITINARETVVLTGEGPAPLNRSELISSQISTTVESQAEGKAGDIKISTGVLVMDDDAFISSNTRGRGDAGNILIDARNRISLSNGRIISEVTEGEGIGQGGNVSISTGSLEMRDGSSILADTEFLGSAGNITINARDAITLSGQDDEGFPSQISSTVESLAIGNGGDITITAGSLSLSDDAFISAKTEGQGNAGDISIESGLFSITGGAEVNTRSLGLGRPGSITVHGVDRFVIDGSGSGLFSTTRDSALAFEARNDAGQSLENAQDLTVDGTPQDRYRIVGVLGSEDDVDIYRIFLEGNQTFSATTSNRLTDRIGTDTRLFLFDANGQGIYFNDDVANNDVQSTLPAQHPLTPLAPGEYYLAVTSYANEALSAGGNIFGSGSFTDILRSTGAGGSLPLSNWDNGGTDEGGYIIDLTEIVAPLIPGQDGRGISIAAETLEVKNGAEINANTFGAGNAGSITIEGSNLFVETGGQITSSTSGSGAAGNINISADRVQMTDRGQVAASTSGTGIAGNISIRAAETVGLDNSRIATEVLPGAVVNAQQTANITIQTDSLALKNNAEITASTSGQGNTGNINIQANDRITLNNDSQITSTVNRGAIGDSQSIALQTPNLILRNNSAISAATSGHGNSGTIQILDSDRVRLNNSTISTQVNNGAIATQPGNINIQTDALALSNHAQLTASTGGQGNAGNILVRTSGNISLSGSTIQTVSRRNSRGAGGNIEMYSEAIELNASSITARSRGNGNAGNITLSINGQLTASESRITTSTARRDTQGGAINLQSGDVVLSDRSQINAQSEGRGLAGNVSLNVRDRLQLTDSDITTSARRSSGGDIQVNATRTSDGTIRLDTSGIVLLEGDSDITTDSQGDGGNIAIGGTGIIAFDDSDIVSRSSQERGGDITLSSFFSETNPPGSAEEFDGNEQVDLNAAGALESGRINTTDTSTIQNSLSDLPDAAVDVNQILANSCIVQTQQSGTFLVTGTGGLPQRPSDASLSPYATGTVRLLSEAPMAAADWQLGDAIVEPQNVYQLPDGRLVMSRECV